MTLKDPLHQGQVDLLHWIADGCPAGRYEGSGYKTSTTALVSRRLVTVSKRGGVWSASLTTAGEHYVKHGAYPPGHWETKSRKRSGATGSSAPSVAAAKGKPPAAPKPKPKPREEPPLPDLEPSRALLAELRAAGGALDRQTDDPITYYQQASIANRYLLKADGLAVLVRAAGARDQLEIRLVDVATWRTETPDTVAAKDRIGRWHPVVAEVRSSKRLAHVSKEHQHRAALLLHCLAGEAEARGLKTTTVKVPAANAGYIAHRDAPKGLLRLTTPGGRSCRVGIKQYVIRSRHVPTPQEAAETKRWGWRRYPTYDDTPSDRLALVVYDGDSNYISHEWGDTKKRRRAEDKLGDLLADFIRSDMERDWAAESARIAEQERARRIERENEQARAAYVEHATGLQFKRDAAAWEESQRLRLYLAAMQERASGIEDDADRLAADEWIVWCERYVDEAVDPLGKPIRRPEVPAPSHADIGEFRRALGFGRVGYM